MTEAAATTVSPGNFAPLRVEALVARCRDAGGAPGPAMRCYLKDAQLWLNERFRTGTDIRALVQGRAALIDSVLAAAWAHFGLTGFTDTALIATGGYGRGELHPGSDVDILVLLADGADDAHKAEISAFITFLWDIGLEVGSSVRTLDECVAQAQADITIATNIMEARTLVGDDALLVQMQRRTGPEFLWPGKAFFQAKRDEQIARHRKHNNTEYNLEPDIKNAPGGLRDIQMIGWVAKRHFGVKTLHELVALGFLDESEFQALGDSQNTLWQIRYALHMLTGRGENRLLFDHQRTAAELLDYRDSNANLAVEQLMKRYYRTALVVSQLNEMLLQHFDEAILRAGEQDVVTPVNSRFQLRNDYLEVTHDKVFERMPPALIEAFVLLGQSPVIKGMRASTVRLIKQNLHRIDAAFRNDLRAITLFMELLRAPHQLFTPLHEMKRYGVLGAYLPAFGQIIGMMQYDLFHIYTVDAHTLLVVKNMRRFRYPEVREKFPLVWDVYHRLSKPELLYLSGLFHDIAKGRGGDHSAIGEHEARDFCLHHRLNKWNANLVAWLVKNHLLMSVTAQKKDVSDPDVVMEFAHTVGDQIHLDYLYCLTVADINATNPNLWNGWRATLLRQLYIETKRVLRRGLETRVERHTWIDETKAAALTLLRQRGIDEEDALKLWAGLGDDYFLRETADEVAWHTEAILAHPDDGGPLVLVRNTTQHDFEGATQIFVYTRDMPNLFAASVAALAAQHLNILDAKIITSTLGFSLDTYIVLDESGERIGDNSTRMTEIRRALADAVHDPLAFTALVQRRMPRQYRHFRFPTEVTISNDRAGRTAVELITLDRPGLLARIGRIFMEFNLLLQNARIATLGERVEDVFFVTGSDGKPLADADLCARLQQTLREQLDSSDE
ncbi:MAG: [protein-PII] uridylyltransferase [Pseudomonadota bacterium]